MLNDSDFLKPYEPNISRLTAEQRETIDAVVDSLIDYPPYALSDMVHKEKPWLDARGDLPPGARCKKIIPKESMLEYYSENW